MMRTNRLHLSPKMWIDQTAQTLPKTTAMLDLLKLTIAYFHALKYGLPSVDITIATNFTFKCTCEDRIPYNPLSLPFSTLHWFWNTCHTNTTLRTTNSIKVGVFPGAYFSGLGEVGESKREQLFTIDSVRLLLQNPSCSISSLVLRQTKDVFSGPALANPRFLR